MSETVIQLPSGLTVAVEPMVSTRTASVGVWVGVGARDEPAHLSGVSHFLEHLLFKGTATRDAIGISQAVDRLGGDINAFTSKEYTAYYCRVPARHVGIAVELLGDVVTGPLLRDDDIESERQVIMEELAMDDDSPEDVAHRSFASAVFGEHPLGRDTAGERATVRAITPGDIRAFFHEHYRTEHTTVAVAGAVDPDEVIDLVTKWFDPMPGGRSSVRRDDWTPFDVPQRRIEIADDTEQVHLVIGEQALARTDPDREALDVVNHVLGGGLSSRLFDEIRERRGLAYSVFSSGTAFADAGAWSVYAGTLPEHRDEVEQLVVRELGRLTTEGITADELAIARGYLVGSYEMGLEDSSARMSRLGGQLTLLGRLRSVEEQIDRWNAVTLDDVRRVIERVYTVDPVTVALGPR
jgi:predicted Zn-dependent peptidase